MKRFTWWRMEQNPPHNAGERWCASCSILHHVKRFMSHSPNRVRLYIKMTFIYYFMKKIWCETDLVFDEFEIGGAKIWR